jgi:hypothetical protein
MRKWVSGKNYFTVLFAVLRFCEKVHFAEKRVLLLTNLQFCIYYIHNVVSTNRESP